MVRVLFWELQRGFGFGQMNKEALIFSSLLAMCFFAQCNTVQKGGLQEIMFRDEPPQEIAGATAVYGGGYVIAVNARCQSQDMTNHEVMCEKAVLMRLDGHGEVIWTYVLTGRVRIVSVAELEPGVIVFAANESTGGENIGFVEAVQDGEKVWAFKDFGTPSSVRDVAVALDGVWVAGTQGLFGLVILLDSESGAKKWEWKLDRLEAPVERRVEESVVTALVPAREKGAFAVGTVRRAGGARDLWVGRFRGAVKPASHDDFEQHMGTPGYDDEPGSFVLLEQGLLVAVRDLNPESSTLTFYRFDPESASRPPEAILALDGTKYRWRSASEDGRGGAILSGAWRAGMAGAFEPVALAVDNLGNPLWQSEIGWGKRIIRAEGMATFVCRGDASLVGGWLVEAGKVIGFLEKVD